MQPAPPLAGPSFPPPGWLTREQAAARLGVRPAMLQKGTWKWRAALAEHAVRMPPTQSTVWDIDAKDQDADTDHGTQKPLECMARPVRNHGARGDGVYDPFCGSGTTVIAAERLGRRCYAMEVSPAYADVIRLRWQAFTGKTAERVPVGDAGDGPAATETAPVTSTGAGKKGGV